LPLLAVYGAAFIEIWLGAPTGLALGLPVPIIWGLTVAGSMTSVTIVAFAGDALRGWLLRRFGKGGAPRTGRIYGVWQRYGVPGWGLTSPLFMSPPLGTGVALMLGAPRRRLLVWMFAGVLTWATILTTAGILAVGLIQTVR
jgi:hypothetical protein